MRRLSLTWLFAMVFGLVSLAAAGSSTQQSAGDSIVGTWNGNWTAEGAAGGGFELTVEKVNDTLTGRVSVTGEPTYKTSIKTIKMDGAKMDARYDFPEDDRIEVVLAIAFEGSKGSGTWTAREKGGGDVATGTLMLAKQ